MQDPIPIPTPTQPIFEPLSEPRISSAWRLSAQAGWNQTEQDWRRLMRLSGASVQVLVRDGEVRASYSVVGYGSAVAWIGMILVDEVYRGSGLGKITFGAALQAASGFGTMGLDATDLGEPIYLKRGFVVSSPIVRWIGGSGDAAQLEGSLRENLNPGILAFDARVTGLDRSDLLRDLAASGARILGFENGGSTPAYGILREGRTAAHLGPVVADSADGFARILDQALAICGGSPLICDALSDEAETILLSRGMRAARYLKRMTRPLQASCLCGPGVWCAAGFELG